MKEREFYMIGQTFEQRVVYKDNLILWTESFGNKSDPAIVLIMGNGGQGIFWPQKFCEDLSRKGFLVIRYDHRDTGLSSLFDFKTNPYTLLDMAKDVVRIMDDYKIKQAHIVSASMGGAIAAILGAHFSDRINTLTLGVTSPDFQVSIDAFMGKDYESHLSKPTQFVLDAAKEMVNKPVTLEEKINVFMRSAEIYSGSSVPIDVEFFHQLALQSIQRTVNEASSYNHFLALQSSYEIHRESLKNIRLPTLIIHGDSDPLFPSDHAEALNKIIPGSRLLIVPGLGHGLTNSYFYQPIIQGIVEIIESAEIKKV